MQWTNTTLVISKWGTFSAFSFFCYLVLSDSKYFQIIPCCYFKCNSILYFIYMYSYWRIASHCFKVFDDIPKIISNIDTEYDPSVIEILYSTSELIFWIFYFCIAFLCFSMHNIYHFSLSIFHMKDQIITY